MSMMRSSIITSGGRGAISQLSTRLGRQQIGTGWRRLSQIGKRSLKLFG
jgi:hypothetical protein